MSTAAPESLDAGLSVDELIHAAGYTQRIRGAADYRLLQIVSRIHEHREDEHIAELAEQAPPSESGGVEGVLAPRDKYGPNGLERAIGDIGAELCVTPQRAKRLIATASAVRYRLPETARTLAEGFIDLDRMMMAVGRSDLVGREEILRLDRELAVEIVHRGPMSTQRFQTLIDRLIHKHDPQAIRRRAARTDEDRNIAIGPDRFTTGQARISGSLPSAQAAIINARLDAMAKEVHRGDGRTLKQRRADAYVALAQGRQHLVCGCDDCAAARTAAAAARTADGDTGTDGNDAGSMDVNSNEGAVQSVRSDGLDEFAADGSANSGADNPADFQDSDPCAGHSDSAAADGVGSANAGRGDSAAALPDSEPGAAASSTCNHPTTPYMYVVVNLSTLLGIDEDPAYLDGQGLIDADTARALLAEAKRAYVTPPQEDSAAAAERYRPSPKLRALLRAGELCCQFPGCNNPIAYTDLDHHHAHGDGGRTNPRNLASR